MGNLYFLNVLVTVLLVDLKEKNTSELRVSLSLITCTLVWLSLKLGCVEAELLVQVVYQIKNTH